MPAELAAVFALLKPVLADQRERFSSDAGVSL